MTPPRDPITRGLREKCDDTTVMILQKLVNEMRMYDEEHANATAKELIMHLLEWITS